MRTAPRRLVLVGTVLVDVLLYLDQMPETGGALLATHSLVTSGAGYNVLAAAVRLGLPAAYAGVVGTGPFGAIVRRDLAALGVPTLLPAHDTDTDTGFDVALVVTGEQPTFIGSPGAESALTRSDLDSVPTRPGDAVYLSGYDLSYTHAGQAVADWSTALPRDRSLVLDPGPLVAAIPKERMDAVLRRADLLSLNAAEAAALTGDTDPEGAASTISRDIAAQSWIVVRDGARGCWVSGHGREPRHVPARPTHPVDLTGAGDAHIAALLARLAAGDEIIHAARWANIAASLAISRRGPATGPTATELAAAAETPPESGNGL